MFLSKLVLNPSSGFARRNFSDPYQMHRTLCSMFGDERRPEMLFRIEQLSRKSEQMRTLLQSSEMPDFSRLPDGFLTGHETKYISDQNILDSFSQMSVYHFRLVANPIKKQGNTKIALYKEKDHFEWIMRKADQSGFRIEYLNMASFKLPVKKSSQPEKDDKNKFAIFGVKYDGALKITNAGLFTKAYLRGIGPSKSFGFGMLSLKNLA
ncbi:MAG: type I-E CRISPR-associated protein Cas6/Cse3/CasE [Candidatus Kapaibacterium sp.]